MKRILLSIALFLSLLPVGAEGLKTGDIFHLYQGKAPGSETWTLKEVTHAQSDSVGGSLMYFNVSDPTLEAFVPDKPNGTAMVVCPGGGFCMLSYEDEGTLVAKELNRYGITAFVLKYRTNPLTNDDGTVPKDGKELGALVVKQFLTAVMKYKAEHNDSDAILTQLCAETPNEDKAFADADQAMRLVRQHAAQWGLKANKIGIMGFSAGAITTVHQTLFNTPESRPDFSGVIYGGWTSDIKLPELTGPVWLCSPANDIFKLEEPLNIYRACLEAQVPTEFHTFWASEHGFGAKPTDKNVGHWIELMTGFMRDVDFLK